DIDAQGPQNVRIERGQARQQPDGECASGGQSPAAVRFQSLMPEGDCEQTETGKSKCIPIWGRSFVNREQCIKKEDGYSEPHQEQAARLTPGTFPRGDHGPGKSEKDQWRVDEEMLAEKCEQFARMNSKRLFNAAARS